MYNIIITKYADNDYSICVTDDGEDVNSGHSVRGTLTEVLEELDVESLNILKEVASNIKLQEDDKMKTMLFRYVGPISGLQKALDDYIKQLEQSNEDAPQDMVDCDVQH